MSTAAQRLVGRDERYRLADNGAVSVRIETDSGREREELDAELVDISQGGIRLRSRTPMAEGDTLIVTLTPGELSKSSIARAQVCWTTPAPKGRFCSGCSIEPRIPQPVLDHLAASGILERRQDTRQQVSVTLTVCRSWIQPSSRPRS